MNVTLIVAMIYSLNKSVIQNSYNKNACLLQMPTEIF